MQFEGETHYIPKQNLHVYVSTYRKKKSIHVRQYYEKAGVGPKPTQKGITVGSVEEADALIALLSSLKNEL